MLLVQSIRSSVLTQIATEHLDLGVDSFGQVSLMAIDIDVRMSPRLTYCCGWLSCVAAGRRQEWYMVWRHATFAFPVL